MKPDSYILELDKSIFLGSTQQLIKVSEILIAVEKDDDLQDDEKLAIETYARNISVAPSTTEQQKKEDSSNRRFLPKYNFSETIEIPDGLKEYDFDERCNNITQAYAQWLLETYLPTFHPMPNSEKQYPIAVCLMLLNCNAVLSAKQVIPVPYFLGRNGSGKTELGKSIAQHYPRHLWIEIRPNNTGASVRDNLDNLFGSGEVGYALFDNFHPKTFFEKMGAHYDLILANCKESSISRVSSASNEQGKSEFRTYCYKAFTSIFDPEVVGESEMGEMYRRMIVLRFQESKPKDSRIIYDWEGMQRVFQRIWGEEALPQINEVYAKALGKLGRIKPNNVPIDGKRWGICQVPIAVGIYSGIFSNIQQGIEAFAEHFRWLQQGNTSAVGSALSIVLSRYIKDELPKLAREASNPYSSLYGRFDATKITQKELTDYLQSSIGYAVTKRELDELIMLMSNFGYNYQRIDNTMGFVKDTPPTPS